MLSKAPKTWQRNVIRNLYNCPLNQQSARQKIQKKTTPYTTTQYPYTTDTSKFIRDSISKVVIKLENKFYFPKIKNPQTDLKVFYDLLEYSLEKKEDGSKNIQNILQKIQSYSSQEKITLMNLITAPNYAGSFEIVVKEVDGPWLIDHDNKRYLNANTSYGAKRFPALKEFNTGDLQSRAFYSEKQILASLIANTYAKNVGIDTPKSLILMSGSDVMKAAYDGCDRQFNNKCTHIIFKNHFHGRAIFNTWNYESKEEFDKLKTVVLEFNNNQELSTTVASILKEKPDHGVAIYFEPVQGEGGVTPITKEFETTLCKLQSQYPDNVVIIADCVQRGFAGNNLFGLTSLVPNAMALSKSVNNGNYPVGMLVGKAAFMDIAFAPGTHGGTSSLREDSCKSIIDAFKMFTSTQAISLLQQNTDELLKLFSDINNTNISIKTDGSSMIGIYCKNQSDAEAFQKKAFNCGDTLKENSQLKELLFSKHMEHLDLLKQQYIREFFNGEFKGMPLKIASDKHTLRFSAQVVDPTDLAKIKIIIDYVFGKN